MPRPLRIALTGIAFFTFFVGSLLLGLVAVPVIFVVSLGDRTRLRDRSTRLIGWGYGTFLFFMRFMGLIGWHRMPFPRELEGRGYVLIGNHPTLIDVLFFLNWFPGLTSVAKASWYDSVFLGALLRAMHYIPGPRPNEGDGLESPALDRMVAHLKAGHPLVLFPEGTRSKRDHLNRIRRGAFEAAVRAGVPLVTVFIRCDPLTLMKGSPFWDVPPRRAMYRFELVSIVETEGADALELHRTVSAELKRRFAAWQRERAGEVEVREVATREG
jgi:1-acyl-sn-glycerol-3-phosphate acyltransferase